MIRFFIIIAVFSLALLSSAMDYPCCKLRQSPVLDGKLIDTVWGNIPSATGFKSYGSGGFALRQAWFKAGYTDKALYIAIDIREEDFNSALCNLPSSHRLMELDNTIHIKFNTSKGISIFTVNSNNFRSSTIAGCSGLWSNFSSAVVRGKDNWQLEIKIPFGKNLIKPKAGQKYDFFIAQYCRDDDRYSIYAPWGNELMFLWGKEAYKNKITFLNLFANARLCKRSERSLNSKFHTYLNAQLKILKQLVKLDLAWNRNSLTGQLEQKIDNRKVLSFNASTLLDDYYYQRDLIKYYDDVAFKKMLIDLTK